MMLVYHAENSLWLDAGLRILILISYGAHPLEIVLLETIVKWDDLFQNLSLILLCIFPLKDLIQIP